MKTATNIEAVNEIIASWGTFDSVLETARRGVSEADLESIAEIAEREGLDAESLAADLLEVCRERAAEGAVKMFAIRCGSVCVGSVFSAANGSDWYNVNRGWTPAKNEATEFETRAEAERVIAEKSLANAAIVVEISE